MDGDESYQDLSAFDEPLRQLALIQMSSGAASIILTALANGDVIASIIRKPGGGSIPYARIDHLTRMLYLLPNDRTQDGD
jgi:hypothetical protein